MDGSDDNPRGGYRVKVRGIATDVGLAVTRPCQHEPERVSEHLGCAGLLPQLAPTKERSQSKLVLYNNNNSISVNKGLNLF